MESLRDRIESVIEATIKRGTDCENGPSCSKCLSLHVADAVIAELGLRVDRFGTATRWVTEWENIR